MGTRTMRFARAAIRGWVIVMVVMVALVSSVNALQPQSRTWVWSAYGMAVLPCLLMVALFWQLMRARAWAWWLLAILHAAALLVMLTMGLTNIATHGHGFPFGSEYPLAYLIVALPFLFLLVMLLTYRPSKWQAPRGEA
jgi:hypothetical protein